MTILERAPASVRARVAGQQLKPRAAWLVLAASTALYLALRLVWDPPHFTDVFVYRAEALALRDGLDLYGQLPGVDLPNTYPPFAAAMFLPLLLVPSDAVGLLSFFLNLGLVWGAAYLSVRRLGSASAARVSAPLLAAVALWCEPVMLNNSFGQINLLILCLVLADFVLPAASRWRGVLVGLATAVKVTPGIFIVYLLVTRRFRAALVASATFGSTVLLSLLITPSATWDYWTHHVLDPNRVGRVENSVNQSVRGWVARAAQTAEPGAAGTLGPVLVLVAAMAAAAYCYRRDGDEWGLLVAAFTGLVVSPISWSHHWVWCVPVLALACHRAPVLVLPTLLAFWSYAVWLVVPHGGELGLSGMQVALSGWYVLHAAAFIACAVALLRTSKNPDPLWRGPGFSRGASGRADRI